MPFTTWCFTHILTHTHTHTHTQTHTHAHTYTHNTCLSYFVWEDGCSRAAASAVFV